MLRAGLQHNPHIREDYVRCGLSGKEEGCKCDWADSGVGGVFTCRSEGFSVLNSWLLASVPASPISGLAISTGAEAS